MNISRKFMISNIRSEIKIPSIIFSGYEYYYLKYLILKNKHTASANIDIMFEIYWIIIILIFINKKIFIYWNI
jgi:hypothetical protein